MKGRKMTIHEKRVKFEQEAGYRREIFQLLLKHLEKGYSLDCFEHASDDSIRRYLKVYKEEWIEEELREAQRIGKTMWEDVGFRQANGQCIGNSRSWYYNMANRYGWREKLDIEQEHKGQVQVNIVSYATSKALELDKEEVVT